MADDPVIFFCRFADRTMADEQAAKVQELQDSIDYESKKKNLHGRPPFVL